MSKSATVIVLDVGPSMAHADSSGMTYMDKAKRTLRLLVQQQILFGKKQDELGVVLMGSDDTEVDECFEDDESYNHITTLVPLETPSVEMLEKIDGIDLQEGKGDFVSALTVAMTMIVNRVAKKKYTKRVWLITDAGSPADDDSVDTIIAGFQNEDVKINVIGMGFSEPESDDESDDDDDKPMEKEEKKLVIPPGRTRVQAEGEALLRRICGELGDNATVLPFNNAIKMLSYFRTKAVSQVSKMRADFHLSPEVSIPVWTFAKTMLNNMPSLKKFSTVAGDEQGTVKMDRVYYNKQSADASMACDPEEKVRAYHYGKTLVTGADNDMLKYEAEKGMWLMGFCDSSRIPRHKFMSGVDAVVPEVGNAAAGVALSGLIHALAELNRVAVVRYVKRANASPVLAVLTPIIKANSECFFLNVLPFREDYRDFDFASLDDNKESAVEQEELLAARAIVRGMDLDKADKDEDGDPVEAIKPKRTFNPALQRFYQCLERRAMDPDTAVADILAKDESIKMIDAYMQPDAALLKAVEDSMKRFKEQFPLERVEEKKDKQKPRHWRDFLAGGAASSAEDAQLAAIKQDKQQADADRDDAKGAGAAGDDIFNLDDLTKEKVDEIRSANPVSDFLAMTSRRDDPSVIARAMSQMVDMIKGLVKASAMGSFHAKALACIEALRAGCVAHQEVNVFNDALKDFRQLYEKKKSKFWGLVVKKSIYPIHNKEVEHSTYTKEEAEKFYFREPEQAAAPVAEKQEAADDDMDILA